MIKKLTDKSFGQFGKIIEYKPRKNPANSKKSKNLFCIVKKETEPTGWRIAYLVVKDKVITRLEMHPKTFESFEPVIGQAVIYLSKDKDFNDIVGFYLDKPIVLKKRVWHGIVAITPKCEVKITENLKVKCKYKRLPEPLSI